MNLCKRMLSALLVLTLLLGMVPLHARAQTETADLSSDVNTEGTNSFGTLLSDEIRQLQAETSGGYNVIGLTVEGNTATVEFVTLERANLVVALYSENGLKQLASANTLVQPEQTVATVTLQGDIPEYFMASAYLLDVYDYSPLCSAYDTPMYTQEMQRLLASTVEDYDPDRVLNLDDDHTTNFAVYAQDTVAIPYTEGANTVASVDNDSKTYVIENADESIKGLAIGDVFVYPYGESDLLIAKIAGITVEGTTVTITGGDVEMEEVFSHLKLETTGGSGDATVDETGVSEGVTYLGKNALDTMTLVEEAQDTTAEAKQSLDFALNLVEGDYFSFDGILRLEIGVELNYYISASYQRMLFSMKNELSISAEVKAESKWAPEWELTPLEIPLLAGAVIVGVQPGVELSLTMKGTFAAKLSSTSGFYFSHDSGGWDCRDLSTDPQLELSQKIEGELGISVYLEPHIGLAGGILADVSVKLSFGGAATAALSQEMGASGDKIHECTGCVDGDIKVFVKAEAELQFLKMEFLTFKAQLAELSCKIGDFYACDSHNVTLAWGECPYISYHIAVQVNDGASPVEGASVEVDGQTVLTNENGTAAFYLPKEEYKITVTCGDRGAVKQVYADRAQKIAVQLGGQGSADPFQNQGVTEVDLISAVGNVLGSGMCGTNASWILYENGLLQIRGTGSVTSTPWSDYTTSIQYLKIDNEIYFGVSYPFRDCVNLVSVRIPAKLSTGYLNGCSNITSIHYTCPEGSTVSMPDYQYYYDWVAKYCRDSLKTVVIDEGVTHIGSMTFVDCLKLESVSLPSTLKSIGWQTFQNCPELTTIAFPEGLEAVESYAFNDCTGLVTAVLPDSVQTLGEYAFQNCSSLQNAGGPSSLESIGKYCFNGCTNLKAFTLSEQLTTLPEYCFQNCSSIEKIVIPNSVTLINSKAFSGCIGLTDLTVPAHLKAGNYFDGCVNITSIHYTCPEGSTVSMPDHQYYYDWAAKYCRDSLKTVVIDEGVTRIGSMTFVDCLKLESVSLPSTLKSIGWQTFQNCPELTTVAFPEGLEAVESYAFNGCTGLVTAVLPDSVQTLGEYAFQNCSSLQNAGGPANLTSIGKYCFNGCTGLKAFILSEQLTTLPEYCFQNCSAIEKIVIPNSVTLINSKAFSGCTGLTDLTVPAHLKAGNYFDGCVNITSIHYTCPEGSTVSMPDHQYYYDWAAKYCRYSLKTVVIDEGVTRIGSMTFVDCLKLESVSLPSTLKSIGWQTFQNCPELTTVAFPEGLEAIESYAFNGCTGLVTAVLPDSVQTLGEYAFQNCSSLQNAGGPSSLESIGKYCFNGCTSLKAFTLSEQLTTLPEYCFQNCSSIEKIVIPNSVTVINSKAFKDCTGLTDLTIPAHIKGGNYFDGCANITGIHYTCPEGSTVSMQDYEGHYDWVVKYCRYSLKTVVIDEGVTHIGNITFAECSELESVSLPSTLTSIGGQAFQNCTSLTELYFIGDAPAVQSSTFNSVTATVYYPENNTTWTASVMQNYGGSLIWTPYTPVKTLETKQTKTVEYSVAVQEASNGETGESISVYAVFDGIEEETVFDTYAVSTSSFTGLTAGKSYAILILRSLDAAEPLSADNLLYITQKTADNNGALSVKYTSLEDGKTVCAVACGASDKDLKNAVISVLPQVADGQLKTVTAQVSYDGKVLTEGVDYTVVGTAAYTDAGTYTCYIRGIRAYTGLVECAYTVNSAVQVSQWNLTLGDRIGMNFYVAMEDAVAESVVAEITVAGETATCPASEAVWDETTGTYRFTAELAAAQMTEEVILRLKLGEDVLEENTYCVRGYADYILDEDNGYNEATRDLVTQMLHFGAMAQLYFAHNTGVLANSGIDAGAQTAVPDSAPTEILQAGRAEGIIWYGSTLVFGSNTAVRFYFKTDEDISGYTFTVAGEPCTPVEKDGMYCIEVADIAPDALSRSVTVTVNGTLEVSYSPINYIVRMYAAVDNGALRDLLQAMYGYHLAAVAYRAANK